MALSIRIIARNTITAFLKLLVWYTLASVLEVRKEYCID